MFPTVVKVDKKSKLNTFFQSYHKVSKLKKEYKGDDVEHAKNENYA